jgi:hypothetical protein
MTDKATPTPSQVADLDETEARRILTSIARASSNDSARISAIRYLRELKAQEPAKPTEGFGALDQLADKRAEKGAA